MKIDEEINIWYSSLINDSLQSGLPVSLFIATNGNLGVKIDDVEFPYFAWESFEEIVGGEEANEKARKVIGKIIDARGVGQVNESD